MEVKSRLQRGPKHGVSAGPDSGGTRGSTHLAHSRVDWSIGEDKIHAVPSWDSYPLR